MTTRTTQEKHHPRETGIVAFALAICVAMIVGGGACSACSPTATAAQAQAANAVAQVANGLQPALMAAYEADSKACVAAAESYAAGQQCFVTVDDRYKNVFAARDALRIAQGAWADELEQGSGKATPQTAERVARAWCALVAAAPPAVHLPAAISCAPAAPNALDGGAAS
jgi:hypothetical protein